jgi:hypothetical protein
LKILGGFVLRIVIVCIQAASNRVKRTTTGKAAQKYTTVQIGISRKQKPVNEMVIPANGAVYKNPNSPER